MSHLTCHLHEISIWLFQIFICRYATFMISLFSHDFVNIKTLSKYLFFIFGHNFIQLLYATMFLKN